MLCVGRRCRPDLPCEEDPRVDLADLPDPLNSYELLLLLMLPILIQSYHVIIKDEITR